MKQNAEGAWDVTVKVKAKKYRSDDKGDQTELDFNDSMDVGALDERRQRLFLEKRRITKGESELSFTVPVKPAQVGIDPLNKLVDRTSTDNVTEPTVASALALGVRPRPDGSGPPMKRRKGARPIGASSLPGLHGGP